MKKNDLYPETVEDALSKWDGMETVFTIEMGGLGPGYEQAIQIGVIEMCRLLLGEKFPEDNKELNDFFDKNLSTVNRKFDLQLSGAQAGAINNLSYRYLKNGWANTIRDFKKQCPEQEDRIILVSNHWPGQKGVKP